MGRYHSSDFIKLADESWQTLTPANIINNNVSRSPTLTDHQIPSVSVQRSCEVTAHRLYKPPRRQWLLLSLSAAPAHRKEEMRNLTSVFSNIFHRMLTLSIAWITSCQPSRMTVYHSRLCVSHVRNRNVKYGLLAPMSISGNTQHPKTQDPATSWDVFILLLSVPV